MDTGLLIVTPAILLGMAIFFAGFLSIAKVKLHVDEDPRIEKVQNVLPAANCGGCGFAGCSDFAKAVVEQRADATGCTVGGPTVAEAVAAVLGVESVQTYPYRPVIHCGAKNHDRLGRVPYDGVASCVEADVVGVTQACKYGCLGFGDCVKSCNYDALHLVDGLPVVDYDKCTGCGVCTHACPRNLIERIPFSQDRMLVIACSNKEPAKNVKQVCKVGCVGCKACQRLFAELFEVNSNLAYVNYENYSGEEELDTAIQKCPTSVMAYFGKDRACEKEHVPVTDAQKALDVLVTELAEDVELSAKAEQDLDKLDQEVRHLAALCSSAKAPEISTRSDEYAQTQQKSG